MSRVEWFKGQQSTTILDWLSVLRKLDLPVLVDSAAIPFRSATKTAIPNAFAIVSMRLPVDHQLNSPATPDFLGALPRTPYPMIPNVCERQVLGKPPNL